MYVPLQNIVCSFARLLAKLLWPGNGEVIFAVFESSCLLLLPAYPLKR